MYVYCLGQLTDRETVKVCHDIISNLPLNRGEVGYQMLYGNFLTRGAMPFLL